MAARRSAVGAWVRGAVLAAAAALAPLVVTAGAQPARTRVVVRDSMARDSGLRVRVALDSQSLERLFNELLRSQRVEEALALAWREAAVHRLDERRVKVLSDSMSTLARRIAGLSTTIELRCAREEEMPEGYLGVQAEELTPSGAGKQVYRFGRKPTILTVEPGSPADKVGIQRGDVLVSIGRQDVRSDVALGDILKPGARVPVVVWRDGVAKEFTVLVGKRPPGFGTRCSAMEEVFGPDRAGPAAFAFVTPAPGRAPRAPEYTPRAEALPRTSAPAVAPGGALPPGFAYAFGPMATTSHIAGAHVMAVDNDWRESLGVDNGLVVLKVLPNTPARDAGLRGHDVIIAADDQPLSSARVLQRILGNSETRAVKLRVVRGDKVLTLTLKWEERER